jgi:NAD(P)-dependent dehydrogenase (short-subunit alcohol dehydrogenase family)
MGGETTIRSVRIAHRLDILVNNSGVYEFAPLEAITEEPA